MSASGERPGADDVTDRLLEAVYEQLRKVAQRRMNDERREHSLQATALVHEAYLRLVRDEDLQWSSRAQFYVAAARAMERILIEHARKRNRLKRGGGRPTVAADVVDLATTGSFEDAVALHDAIDRLEAEDARAALVTRLRFFAGLTVEETANAVGLSERTVMREWNYARAWLRDALGPGHD